MIATAAAMTTVHSQPIARSTGGSTNGPITSGRLAINIMIAIIKETTLLSVIGVTDILGAVENGAKSPDWVGEPNILTSGHVFLALTYLAICYGLSRYSRRLEASR